MQGRSQRGSCHRSGSAERVASKARVSPTHVRGSGEDGEVVPRQKHQAVLVSAEGLVDKVEDLFVQQCTNAGASHFAIPEQAHIARPRLLCHCSSAALVASC